MADRTYRQPRTEVLRARVTAITKAEVEAIRQREDRTESDTVRILIEEALTARAAGRRR